MSEFRFCLSELQKIVNGFSAEDVTNKKHLLEKLSEEKLPLSTALAKYQHVLLFLIGYPSNEDERRLVLSEMDRIARFLQENKKDKSVLTGSGLPFTHTLSSFSFDLLQWAEKEFPGRFEFDSFGGGAATVSGLLLHTLPDLQKEILTEEGMKGRRLMRILFGRKENYHRGILGETSKLNHISSIRDQLFEAMDMYSVFKPVDASQSFFFNRHEPSAIFYQESILKKFDHTKLMDSPLPKAKKISLGEQNGLQRIIRMSLLLLGRETEPSTWMDSDSIKLFELEHGISVCLYGMTVDHRQPLESYFGFTAFKNGYPMSYGGAWLFGKRALFGMNIFEWFRGGESAFVFAQLIRTYRQCFGIEYFEVEPYQYGKDNPEGISSGAFWFYHRFGFRLIDKELDRLSQTESNKIASQKSYRTPVGILKKFTRSNIGLHLSQDGEAPLSPSQVRSRLSEFIAKKFDGDSRKALHESVKQFVKLTGCRARGREEKKVLADLALFVMSSADTEYYVKKKKDIQRLIQMKVSDEFSFQLLLRKFLE